MEEIIHFDRYFRFSWRSRKSKSLSSERLDEFKRMKG